MEEIGCIASVIYFNIICRLQNFVYHKNLNKKIICVSIFNVMVMHIYYLSTLFSYRINQLVREQTYFKLYNDIT